MNTKTIKTVPIIINHFFLTSSVFYRSILDTYSNIIIEKEFTDFTARFPAFKNSEFISDTFYSITDMQSEKKTLKLRLQ